MRPADANDWGALEALDGDGGPELSAASSCISPYREPDWDF